LGMRWARGRASETPAAPSRLLSDTRYFLSGPQLRVNPRPTQVRGRNQQHADLDRMGRLVRGLTRVRTHGFVAASCAGADEGRAYVCREPVRPDGGDSRTRFRCGFPFVQDPRRTERHLLPVPSWRRPGCAVVLDGDMCRTGSEPAILPPGLVEECRALPTSRAGTEHHRRLGLGA
jgi:hypothetical protein